MTQGRASTDDDAWADALAAAYRADARFLWGLCYRMSGSAAAADDLVHETFVRALQRPPADRDAPLRPWLTRVALNLAIDALRRRKRAAYDGPWLPEVIDTAGDDDTAAAYERREGLTLGFLALLELLSPQQRAVVLLRDVYELSVAETAALLAAPVNSIKVAHHRARARLGAASEAPPDAARRQQHALALVALFEAIGSGELTRVVAALEADARVISDGGGAVRAARRVVSGAGDVARLLTGLARKGGAGGELSLREVNQLPAFELRRAPVDARDAARIIIQVALGPGGRPGQIFFVLTPAKLGGLDRPRGPAPPRDELAALLARARAD